MAAGQVDGLFEYRLELLSGVPRITLDVEYKHAVLPLVALPCVQQDFRHDVFKIATRQLQVVRQERKLLFN